LFCLLNIRHKFSSLAVLGIELTDLGLLGKHSTTWATPPSHLYEETTQKSCQFPMLLGQAKRMSSAIILPGLEF
jgi:hypothetical protein